MLTLKEALFSRKNIKRYTLRDLKDEYGIVVLEYLINKENTAFIAFDTFYKRFIAIVKDNSSINQWYFIDENYKEIYYLRDILASKSVIPVVFYCTKSSTSSLFYKLKKIMKDMNYSYYDPDELRSEIKSIIKPYIELYPDDMEIK